MAWELHVWCGGDEQKDPNACWSLGRIEDVRTTIDSFFADIDWEDTFRGTCDFKAGTIEFDLHGDPPRYVALRVHGANPTLELIAMGRCRGWIVTDDSTGASLEPESQHDDSEIHRLKLAAEAVRKVSKSPQVAPKFTMPRIKARIVLTDVPYASAFRKLEMVELRNNEVTQDLARQYEEAVERDEKTRNLKCLARFGTAEVHLPDGERLATCFFSRLIPEVNAFFDHYWKRASRSTAKFMTGHVVFGDGKKFNGSECFWVERAAGGRNRGATMD